MVVVIFSKKVIEKDGAYNETDWQEVIEKNIHTKTLYHEYLKAWITDYLNKNFPQVGYKNFVFLKAGILKQIIPCSKKCPDVNVSQIIANFYSSHGNLPVPDKAVLTYYSIDKREQGTKASFTKYVLKALPNFEVYWERQFIKQKKQIKTVKITLNRMDIKETIKNKELINLVYYNMFDINKSKYEDAIEFIKLTNPDGVIYYEFHLQNNIIDYENPINNYNSIVTEKKYILEIPDMIWREK